MGHKPAEAVTRNAVVNMTCVEEPALILIRHCQDMKKQETRLRFITLLLLLGCGSLFLYISCAVLWFHREPAGTEHTVSSCLLFCFLLRNASVSLSVAKRCSTFLEMMQNPTTQRRKTHLCLLMHRSLCLTDEWTINGLWSRPSREFTHTLSHYNIGECWWGLAWIRFLKTFLAKKCKPWTSFWPVTSLPAVRTIHLK